MARQFGTVLKSNDVVKVTEGNVTTGANDKKVLIVAAMEMLHAAVPPLQEAATNMEEDPKPAAVPAPKAPAPAPAPAAPAAVTSPTAPPTAAKTPACGLKTAAGPPKSGPSPPSSGKSTGIKRSVLPISSLNPYMHGWAIQARVMSKGPKRSFNRNGGESSVFSAELLDEHGTRIEATFWREAAERLYDTLQVCLCYVLGAGGVCGWCVSLRCQAVVVPRAANLCVHPCCSCPLDNASSPSLYTHTPPPLYHLLPLSITPTSASLL